MTDPTTSPTEPTPPTTIEPLVEPTPSTTAEPVDDPSLITKGDPAEDPKSEPAPEPITVEDLVLPDGFEVDEAAQASLVEILNKGLPAKELAGELINLQTTMAQAASDSISDAWNTMQEAWKQEAQALPDFGGDKLAPTLGSIKELINDVAGTEAKAVFDALDLTGAGSHPALISLLGKLAAERAEGKLTSGDVSPLPTSAAEVMFPNQGKT